MRLGEKIASAAGLNTYLAEVAPHHQKSKHTIPLFHTGRGEGHLPSVGQDRSKGLRSNLNFYQALVGPIMNDFFTMICLGVMDM